jgi:hypothetical protein
MESHIEIAFRIAFVTLWHALCPGGLAYTCLSDDEEESVK